MAKSARRNRWALVLLGGWMLWYQVGTTTIVEEEPHIRQESKWGVLSTFETQHECGVTALLVMDDQEDRALREGRSYERSQNLITERFHPRTFGRYAVVSRYLCLPETIDPRAPKTK
jgi:hypothetical protein